jgi:hypothetical protein
MQALKKQLNHKLALFLFSSLLSAIPAMAATDLTAQEGFARALAKSHQKETDLAAHENHTDKSLEFHGVFTAFSLATIAPGLKRRCL